MIEPIIRGLDNEAYHHEKPYSDYLSSSQLKAYAKSPKAAKYALDNPEEDKTDALRFGSLFHLAMEKFQQFGTIDAFYDRIAVFTPPVNEKTGQPYGNTSKAYKEAYEQFCEQNIGKEIVSAETAHQIDDMVGTLVRPSVGGETAKQVLKLLKWGEPEVSHFIEYQGCGFKWRPDLETKKKIIDWKTVATNDLREESLNRIILKYGYHISSSFYQFFTHEQTGEWKDFYIVFVSKEPPFDCVMVNMTNYGYRYYPEVDMVGQGPGAMEFKKLLDLHIKCSQNKEWPGAESFIAPDSKVKVLEIQPPSYYSRKFIEEI